MATLGTLGLLALALATGGPEGAARPPVLVGLDAEFGYAHSTSAEAIREGVQIAIEEINAAGGVLGGRPLALVERANHSVPARSIENVRELAAMKDLVAVFCGRFSPTVLEVLPVLHEVQLPLLDPWSAAERLPILSHWGVTGGALPELAGPALQEVDFSTVQTWTFVGATSPRARRVVEAHRRLSGSAGPRAIRAPVGVAHAYDLTHLLARAVDRAGSTDRRAIRDALERLGPYAGLVRDYERPFTPTRHEALTRADVFVVRYAADGAIVPASRERRRGR